MGQTNGSEEKGMTAIGFVIYDITDSEFVYRKDVHFGVTSTEAELYTLLLVLSFVVAQKWKYTGDHIHLKSNSALAVLFLTHQQKAEAELLVEFVETIRNLVHKEKL